jgi:cytochrome c-type biogenesis protein
VDVAIIAALFAGAASFLSPCVLPLLPGYISLMSGYDMAELAEGNVSTKRVVGRTALFVLGFSSVFVALGASATALSSFLNSAWVTTLAGWVIIIMGLFIAVTAVWTPNFFLPFMKDRRMESSGAKRMGLFGPPVMGAAFAFGWTPCIGPFLATALTLGANSDTVYEGMVVLFFYSVGLGVPFLLTSLLLTKAFSAFDWVKRYLLGVRLGQEVPDPDHCRFRPAARWFRRPVGHRGDRDTIRLVLRSPDEDRSRRPRKRVIARLRLAPDWVIRTTGQLWV